MNIEKFLYDDNKEKKRKNNDNRARMGKKGYKGKMYLASDLMTGREKREYIKPSDVEVFNMYEVLPYQDFLLLDNENRKKRLEEWTKHYTVNEIAEKWDSTYKNAYNQFQRAGVTIVKKAPRGRTGGRRKGTTNKKGNTPKKQETPVESSSNLPAIIEQKIEESKTKPNGFSFAYNGEYTAEEISNKLEKIGILLSDEGGQRYKVEISVAELED